MTMRMPTVLPFCACNLVLWGRGGRNVRIEESGDPQESYLQVLKQHWTVVVLMKGSSVVR